jgi:HEAT repeat protein
VIPEATPKLSHARRSVIWVIVAGIALIIGCYGFVKWLWSGAETYRVDGVPFREWLAQRPDMQIENPIAVVGTNAVPHLIKVLRRTPESPRALQLRQKIWTALPGFLKARFPELRPIPDWQVRRTALWAVRALQSEAQSAMPVVVEIARSETNRMVRAGALVAALNIAPQSSQTFALWRDEWEHTNHFSRRDLALYLGMPRVPIPAAVPYLLREAANQHSEARRAALETLSYFGPEARPAVPDMVGVFDGMLPSLERLGPAAVDAIPALTKFLTEDGPRMTTAYSTVTRSQVTLDTRPGLQAAALEVLTAIGPDASSALPAIAQFLTNSDPSLQMLAASAQAHITRNSDSVLPILLAGLENRLKGTPESYVKIKESVVSHGPQAAAFLIGELGPLGRDASTSLENMLTDKNPFTRVIAAQALWRVSRQAEKCLPVLLEAASDRNADLASIQAIEAIGEMGSVAQTGIPILERLRTNSIAVRHTVNSVLPLIQGRSK